MIQEKKVDASPDEKPALPAASASASKRYAAFLSHYKVEAAMEARYLKRELERTLGRNIFLDSDDLHDLTRLKEAVTESDVLVLLQSARVLERPWCLIEIATALDHDIPIVGVSLTTGGYAYDFAAAAELLQTLERSLNQANPGALELLAKNDINVDDLTWKLSSTIPEMISVGFNPSASKNVLAATIADIVHAVRSAKPLMVQPREQWLSRQATLKKACITFAAGSPGIPRGQTGTSTFL